MNRLTRPFRILLVSAALAAPSQAYALDPSILNQLGSLASLFQEWKTKIQSFTNLKDQLFGSINFNELKNTLTSRLQDMGLEKLTNLTGIDIKQLLSTAQNWQSKLDEIKNNIIQKFTDQWQAFLNPNNFDRKNKLWEAGMLNPDTFSMKFDGLIKQQQEAINKARNVQDIGDAVKALDDSKKTVEQTAQSSEQTTQKAADFAAKVNSIQSTREGVMMLVQAQAALMANQAYNGTAITTAISQNARQQQVTNNQLADLVNDRINERTGEVLGAMHQMRIAEAEAVATGAQVKDTINWAADGFSSAFEEVSNVDTQSMFN